MANNFHIEYSQIKNIIYNKVFEEHKFITNVSDPQCNQVINKKIDEAKRN